MVMIVKDTYPPIKPEQFFTGNQNPHS